MLICSSSERSTLSKRLIFNRSPSENLTVELAEIAGWAGSSFSTGIFLRLAGMTGCRGVRSAKTMFRCACHCQAAAPTPQTVTREPNIKRRFLMDVLRADVMFAYLLLLIALILRFLKCCWRRLIVYSSPLTSGSGH